MSDQVRIYLGDMIRSVFLNPTQEVSFGTSKKCTYQFTKEDCTARSVRFVHKEEGWVVLCTGKVWCEGERIQKVAIQDGDVLLLGEKSGLCIQFFRQSERTAVQILLEDLEEITLGRGPSCTIQLNNSRVSGHHAKIYRVGNEWRIKDLNSKNGTFVDGRRVQDHILNERGSITIGPYDLMMLGQSLQICGNRPSIRIRLPEKKERPRNEYPYFMRSPRLIREKPATKVEIEAAPNIGKKPEINWISVLLPSVGTLSLTFLITMFTGISMYSMMFTAPMMLIGVLVTYNNYRSQSRRFAAMAAALREKYQQYIHSCQEQLEEVVRWQRDAVLYANPKLIQCVKIAKKMDRRLWERTSSDKDFLSLRVGLGQEPICAEIQTPKVGFVLEETEYTRMPSLLAEKYKIVSGIPVLCDLLRVPSLGIIGERRSTIHAAYDLVVQAATHHGYDEVKLVVLFPQKEMEQWSWMRWLPHTYNQTRTLRYMACTQKQAAQILEPLTEELKRRSGSGDSASWDKTSPQIYYLFVIADISLLRSHPVSDYLLKNDPSLGVCSIMLGSSLSELPRGIRQILDAKGKTGELYLRERMDEKRHFDLDEISLQDCERFARALAPIRLPEKDSGQVLPAKVSFLEGYRVQRPEQIDLAGIWANSCNYRSMAVPIGVRADGKPFYFDIHEKKHGPHGLVAGMTGSGKSEMVQSWILSMALHFSPQDVSFVLIDFKGTGLILPFMDLPHLAGTISDLDTNIQRNLSALESELRRRKALFDEAGVNKISDYLKLYRSGRVKEPLPYLFVVIDEYAEFKAKFPDFTTEINSLFQTGRSLGVHILLLTQNPAGVVSGASESNVRFRWCLKVASTAASKEVLGGHDDAAYITDPGRAYVRVGSDEIFEPVQSFYSGAPYQPDREEKENAELAISSVSLTGEKTVAQSLTSKSRAAQGTEIDAVVQYIRQYVQQAGVRDARHIWQPRMPAQIFLPDLLKKAAGHQRGELMPVIGMIDDPALQVQRPLRLPLSREGHAVIYGAPGSGKTVLLQTLTASVCMEYSPEEVHIYVMDFGSWSMGMFRGFPHVAGIANDNEENKITAIAQTLEQELQKRKEQFSAAGVGNLRAYLRATGEKMPYLLLLVDNFAPVYNLYPQLEDFFVRLGREGGNYGICLVASAGTTMALGYKLSQSIKTVLALQMKDSSDYSTVLGRTGGLQPEHLPGRGLCREDRVLEFQTALPVSGEEEGVYAEAVRALGDELLRRWGEVKAAGVAVMPDRIEYGSILPRKGGLVLGLACSPVEPVEFGPKEHHLLVSGLPGSGKTNLLKALVRQAAQGGARIALFGDPENYRSCAQDLEWLPDGTAADAFLEGLSAELTARQAEKAKDPEIRFVPLFLVIDGYKRFFEEIAQQSVSRLRALVLMGKDLGVTLLAADNAADLSMLTEYKEPLTCLLAKGPAVVLGGQGLDHMAVELEIESTQKNAPLGQWEGWYKGSDSVRRFKAIWAETEAGSP